jgi:hypothetical protein
MMYGSEIERTLFKKNEMHNSKGGGVGGLTLVGACKRKARLTGPKSRC